MTIMHRPVDTPTYVDSLQRRENQSVGFLTRTALAEYHARTQIVLASENNDPCGYMIFYDGRNGNRPVNHPAAIRLRQIAIDDRVRRIYHATGLISRLIYHAQANLFQRIELWCATDLDAMKFWRAIGFTEGRVRVGGNKDGRLHALWTLDVPTPRRRREQSVRCTLPDPARDDRE